MGTATFLNQPTRSQSRQTRSTRRAEAILSSPLNVIHGNNLTPSARNQALQMGRTYTRHNASEKENDSVLSTGLRNGKAPEVSLSNGAIDSTVSRETKKRKDSKTRGSHLKRLRTKLESSKNNNEAALACAGSAAPVSKHCETEREAEPNGSVAGHASDGLLSNDPAGAPRNGRGAVIRSDADTGFHDRQTFSGIIVEAELAQRDCGSPVGSDAQRKASAGCTVNEGRVVPSVRPQSTAPSRPDGKGNGKGVLQSVDIANNGESSDIGTSPLSVLQKCYEKMCRKYQKLKVTRFDEVEALYEDQNSRISAFVKATEELLELYKGENNSLRQQIQDANVSELLDRCRELEKENLECRNDLLLERSKNLELRQEIKKLKVVGRPECNGLGPTLSAMHTESIDIRTKVESGLELSNHSRLMQQLLECLLGLKLSLGGDELQFRHGPTGFSFNLKSVHDTDISQLIGGGELMYQNVSLGTLCRKAVDFLKEEEAIVGMDQVHVFFKKLLRFFQQGTYG